MNEDIEYRVVNDAKTGEIAVLFGDRKNNADEPSVLQLWDPATSRYRIVFVKRDGWKTEARRIVWEFNADNEGGPRLSQLARELISCPAFPQEGKDALLNAIRVQAVEMCSMLAGAEVRSSKMRESVMAAANAFGRGEITPAGFVAQLNYELSR